MFSESNNAQNIKPIKKIEFGILGNTEIKNMSALGKETTGVEIPDLYDSLHPKKNGIIDLRMGTTDNTLDCDTCGYNNKYCPGHFGHIELTDPVFHIGFLPHLKKILDCICLRCGKPLINNKNEKDLEEILKNKTGKNRLNEIRKLVKNVNFCQKANNGCGTPVPKIKLEIKKSTASITLILEYENLDNNETTEEKNKKEILELTPAYCRDILKLIDDKTAMLLGLNPKYSRPEDMIIEIFPVPPVPIRPSAKTESMASTLEDDLTHKLADIIKANLRLRKYKETINENTLKYSNDHIHFLQYHCATYLNNETLTLPKSELKGRVTKSLFERFLGKEGHIRGHLMGKRTDFSGRTVIGSDPSIDINELRVPVNIATVLTFPEIVTKYNIEFLKKLVRNGATKYPGANFLIPLSSNKPGSRVLRIDLRYKKESTELRYGDIVERHLLNGDIVLFNRQPTLHKVSMMSHRIVVVNNPNVNSFGMSVYVCKPYNADFDGDEMNLFLPQSIQTQIELEEIADVKKQIINPSTSKTIIGVEQDGLVGSYNLTDPSVKIHWKNAMNIISYISVDNLKNLKKSDYTGQELFSLIIPPKINLSKGEVQIINGELKKGKVTKDVLGAGKQNSIHQLIWDEYGADETVRYLNNNQKLTNNFNLYNGFSIGIDDITISKDLQLQINCVINTKDLKVDHMITEIENNPELIDNIDIFENSLHAELNVVRDDIAKIIQEYFGSTNQVKIMLKAGSKGDATNSGQMCGCVGMQSVSGQIIQKRVNGRGLPYFFQNDDRSDARGLIKSSFISGMGYPQFFYLNQAGREGIIDGAIKSVTGDTEIFVLENNKLKHIKIGDWINNKLENNKDKVKFYPNDREMELLDIEINNKIYIPTTNENGKLEWGLIKAITKHNPGDKLYEIFTNSGRRVIVTESKSLLIWNKNKKIFEQKSMLDVQINDLVPITSRLPDLNTITSNSNRCKCKFIDIIKYISNEESINNNSIDQLYTPNKLIFELNNENGIFIGLIYSNSIFTHTENENENENEFEILYDDKTILNFIKHIFNKFNISYEDTYDSIKCKSVIMYKFIKKIFNIFDEILDTPNEFIKGFLNGYISNKCVIENNSIILKNESSKNINIINLLLSKFNIFCYLTNNEIIIKNNWLLQFIEKITLINEVKNTYLNNMNKSNKYTKLEEYNDIVLDNIIKINILDVDKYPEYSKVYDLTVPSTLNFGLANGLHVVDTAESGYIQRKLVKTLEDLVIKYDNTLRNVNDSIIQFVCGDSGADTRYQYEYNIKLIEQNNADIERIHKFDKEELKGLKFTDKDNNDLYDTIINIRDQLRKTLIKSKLDYITLSTSFLLPVNLNRIINNVKYDEDLTSEDNDDLNPKYILDKLNELLTNKYTTLMCFYKNVDIEKSIKLKDEQLHKSSLKFALYDCLSPKRVIYEYKLNKNQFDIIINKISDNYNKNLIQPGEHAGVISAQALGEPTTQLTLKAFHQAGIAAISNTIQGVPRVKELLSLTKKIKTPQMIIYLNDQYYKNKEMARKISSYIRFTTLGQIRKNIKVYYDPDPYAKDGYMEQDNVFNIYYTHNPTTNSCQADINNLPWLMRIELDREKMLEKEVTLLEIKSKYCNQWEKRYTDIKNIKKEEKYILDKILQSAVLSNSDNDEVPVLHIRFDMIDFDFTILNRFIDIFIEQFKLKGISGINEKTSAIEQRVIKFDNNTGSVLKEEQYVIYTQGVNLLDIRYLLGIDIYKTITNDVVQIYNVFGIEAARAVLAKEISIAYTRNGAADVNYNHVSVIVDLMTVNGVLIAVDRHGMMKSENEPLARISFEKTVEQLITASVFNEVDNMKSVSSRIMAGLVIKGGTGMCNVLLDTELLEKSEYIEDIGTIDNKFNQIQESTFIKDTIDKDFNENIFMPE